MPAGWSASRTRRPFLIAAASARALAASAARGGYRVSAIDLFNDSDLEALADKAARIPRRKTGGFAAAAFLKAAARLAPIARPKCGLVYGAGFEDRPELLERIAARCVIFGNSATALRRCKDPFALARVLDELGLPHPEIRAARPAARDAGNWLVKRRGGAGGIHIRRAPGAKIARGDYFQRFVSGTAVSASVLADGKNAVVLGLSAQTSAPAAGMPLRFGGLVAPALLSRDMAEALGTAARGIAARLKLRGLNGVDFVTDGDSFWVIEVNPRPTASLELFERLYGSSLFDLHVQACQGSLPQGLAIRAGRAAANRILYARERIRIPPGFDWPDWSADRPRSGTVVPENEPVCSVLAEASTPAAGQALAARRSEALRAALLRCMQSPARQEAALPSHGGGTRQEGKHVERTRREHSHTA